MDVKGIRIESARNKKVKELMGGSSCAKAEERVHGVSKYKRESLRTKGMLKPSSQKTLTTGLQT